MAWDADWYRSLAVGGYDALPLEGVRFFPGFILLGRLADALLPGGPTTAMVVVANLGSLLAGVALYRLVLAETASRSPKKYQELARRKGHVAGYTGVI